MRILVVELGNEDTSCGMRMGMFPVRNIMNGSVRNG